MTDTFILAHGEEFIQCPYNTAHQITNSRLTTHLDKCRKAYLKNLSLDGQTKCMKICRYNALHHVPAVELRFHEKRCTDAFSVVRHLAYHNSDAGSKQYKERQEQDSKSGWQQVQRHSSSSSSQREWPLPEEDWETDCASGHTPGYDPSVKLKSEVVIYNPSGLTKSERKKFRNAVRQKAAELSLKGEPVQFPTAADFDIKQDMLADLKIKDEDDTTSANTQHYDDYDRDYRPSSSTTHSRYHPTLKGNQNTKAIFSRTAAVATRAAGDCSDSDDFEGVDPFMSAR